MKSILEQALVHLLNNEGEKAQELMHQFIVERAKEIHESLREGDEADMEDLDATIEEEFFTEADLEDAEAVENLEDDLDDTSVADEDLEAAEVDMADAEADLADAEMDSEMVDADMEELDGEAGDLEGKIDEIEEEIKALQAEFDKLMAEFDSEEMDMEDAEGEMDDAMDMEMDAEGEIEDAEEDFDEITEGMVDDLKKVSGHNEDGRGANGEKLATKTASPIARDAKPRVLAPKSTVGHTGFELEKAPSKKDGPDRGRKYDNNRGKAHDGNSKVAGTGPKTAELNKPVQVNSKSPISGRKTK